MLLKPLVRAGQRHLAGARQQSHYTAGLTAAAPAPRRRWCAAGTGTYAYKVMRALDDLHKKEGPIMGYIVNASGIIILASCGTFGQIEAVFRAKVVKEQAAPSMRERAKKALEQANAQERARRGT